MGTRVKWTLLLRRKTAHGTWHALNRRRQFMHSRASLHGFGIDVDYFLLRVRFISEEAGGM